MYRLRLFTIVMQLKLAEVFACFAEEDIYQQIALGAAKNCTIIKSWNMCFAQFFRLHCSKTKAPCAQLVYIFTPLGTPMSRGRRVSLC